MSETSETYLARRPVLSRAQRVVAYELLVPPDSGSGRPGAPLDPSGAEVLLAAFSRFGREKLLAGRQGLLCVSRELLLSAGIEAFDERLVLLLEPCATVDRDLRARCRVLARNGFKLGLDAFVAADPRECLLEFVSLVRVDVRGLQGLGLKQLSRIPGRPHAQCLATGIQGPADFERVYDAGFELFEGYYFAHPPPDGQPMDPERKALMELWVKVRQDEELDAIERICREHKNLGANLLRLANSGSFARRSKISSVSQALMLIGRRELGRWLTLLLFADAAQGGMSSPLLTTAALRGKTLEGLVRHLHADDDSPTVESLLEQAFMAGMLSLVDVLLGVSRARVADEIAVDDAVRDVLLERKGLLGRMLLLLEKLEEAAFKDVDALLEELGVTHGELEAAQVEAHAWAHRLGEATGID